MFDKYPGYGICLTCVLIVWLLCMRLVWNLVESILSMQWMVVVSCTGCLACSHDVVPCLLHLLLRVWHFKAASKRNGCSEHAKPIVVQRNKRTSKAQGSLSFSFTQCKFYFLANVTFTYKFNVSVTGAVSVFAARIPQFLVFFFSSVWPWNKRVRGRGEIVDVMKVWKKNSNNYFIFTAEVFHWPKLLQLTVALYYCGGVERHFDWLAVFAWL